MVRIFFSYFLLVGIYNDFYLLNQRKDLKYWMDFKIEFCLNDKLLYKLLQLTHAVQGIEKIFSNKI